MAFQCGSVTPDTGVQLNGVVFDKHAGAAVTETGAYVVTLRDDSNMQLQLVWEMRGAALLPCAASVSMLHEVDTTELPTEAMSCSILEHRATIGGAMIQVDIDDSLTTPRLHLSPNQLDVSGRDSDSTLSHPAKLTLGDHTVLVYQQDDGKLSVPSIVIETAEGIVLHNVVVELSESQCPHLTIPSALLNPRS